MYVNVQSVPEGRTTVVLYPWVMYVYMTGLWRGSENFPNYSIYVCIWYILETAQHMQDKNTPSLDPHINGNFISDIHTYIRIYSTCPHMAHIYCLTSERALKRVQDLLKSLVMAKGHLRQLGGVSEDDVQRENELQEHKRYLFSTVYIVQTVYY